MNDIGKMGVARRKTVKINLLVWLLLSTLESLFFVETSVQGNQLHLRELWPATSLS
jgi:hypothetical protein